MNGDDGAWALTRLEALYGCKVVDRFKLGGEAVRRSEARMRSSNVTGLAMRRRNEDAGKASGWEVKLECQDGDAEEEDRMKMK